MPNLATYAIFSIIIGVIVLVVGWLISSKVLKYTEEMPFLEQFTKTKGNPLEYYVACAYYLCADGVDSRAIKLMSSSDFAKEMGFSINCEDFVKEIKLVEMNEKECSRWFASDCHITPFAGKTVKGRCDGRNCVYSEIVDGKKCESSFDPVRVSLSNSLDLHQSKLKEILQKNVVIYTDEVFKECLERFPVPSQIEHADVIIIIPKEKSYQLTEPKDMCDGFDVKVFGLNKYYIYAKNEIITVPVLTEEVLREIPVFIVNLTIPNECIIVGETPVFHGFAEKGKKFGFELELTPPPIGKDTSPCYSYANLVKAYLKQPNSDKEKECETVKMSKDGIVSVSCTIPKDWPEDSALIYGWIDFNNDGKKQPYELSNVREITVASPG